MKRIFTMPLVAVTLAGSVACGSSSNEETRGVSSESALRALDSNEILGTIAYGETRSPIAYTDNPRYRAYTFSGAAGDAVTIDVTSLSVGGDPIVWLLAADNSNLASNHGGHIATTLPGSGTYTIALRDYNLEDQTFGLSLTGPRCEKFHEYGHCEGHQMGNLCTWDNTMGCQNRPSDLCSAFKTCESCTNGVNAGETFTVNNGVAGCEWRAGICQTNFLHAGETTWTAYASRCGGNASGGGSTGGNSNSSGDPFDDASCQGPAMTDAEAATHFLPGETRSLPLGSGIQVQFRHRSCTGPTGCGSWTSIAPGETGWPQVDYVPSNYSVAGGRHAPVPSSGPLTLTVNADTTRFRAGNFNLEFGDPVAVDGSGTYVPTCQGVGMPNLDCAAYDAGDLRGIDLSPVYPRVSSSILTNHCFRVLLDGKDDHTPSHESQVVVFATF